MAVVIETTLGDITVDLFVDQRPTTCLNFLKLCKMKYYNFNLFHTVRSGFIAQTGDPSGEGTGGQSIFGLLEGPEKRFFSGEKIPKIRHTDAGLLSMVCTGEAMVGSQFFFTLGPDLDSLDGVHIVIGAVTEGHDILRKLNDVICDETYRPYQDVRITHTVILEDPFSDPHGLRAPSRSPSPTAERLKGGRIAPDEDIDELQGKSAAEIQELIEEKEAKARATILEIVGDLPDADIAPPENVLFVCKLNPVTSDEDLEIIFSRFGKIVSCEVIRDKKTGDSLQYAFIEFSDKKSCEDAYFKMDNVLIDDRRIHVDFSQSVSKIKWLGKGRGVKHFNDDELNEEKKGRERTRRSPITERNKIENRDRKSHKERYREAADNRRQPYDKESGQRSSRKERGDNIEDRDGNRHDRKRNKSRSPIREIKDRSDRDQNNKARERSDREKSNTSRSKISKSSSKYDDNQERNYPTNKECKQQKGLDETSERERHDKYQKDTVKEDNNEKGHDRHSRDKIKNISPDKIFSSKEKSQDKSQHKSNRRNSPRPNISEIERRLINTSKTDLMSDTAVNEQINSKKKDRHIKVDEKKSRTDSNVVNERQTNDRELAKPEIPNSEENLDKRRKDDEIPDKNDFVERHDKQRHSKHYREAMSIERSESKTSEQRRDRDGSHRHDRPARNIEREKIKIDDNNDEVQERRHQKVASRSKRLERDEFDFQNERERQIRHESDAVRYERDDSKIKNDRERRSTDQRELVSRNYRTEKEDSDDRRRHSRYDRNNRSEDRQNKNQRDERPEYDNSADRTGRERQSKHQREEKRDVDRHRDDYLNGRKDESKERKKEQPDKKITKQSDKPEDKEKGTHSVSKTQKRATKSKNDSKIKKKTKVECTKKNKDKRDVKTRRNSKKRKPSTSSSSSSSSSSSDSSSSSESDHKKKRVRKRKHSSSASSSSSSTSSSSSSSSSSDSSDSSSSDNDSNRKRKKKSVSKKTVKKSKKK